MSAKRNLTDKEIQIMIDDGFVGEERLRNRAMFCLGISTGYRINEILHHKVRDVMAKKYVLDYVELPRRLRKGKKIGQTKSLQEFAKKALQEHLENELLRANALAYGEIFDNWLFPSQKVDRFTGEQKPLSQSGASLIMREAFDRCNITGAVATHSMRKTFAAKVYKQAIKDFRRGKVDIEPLRIVQMHLGHLNIANTIKYLSFLTYDVDASNFQFEI